ncbi:MAG: hypothetical protein R3A48_21465 [Polyangiales bacterium]
MSTELADLLCRRAVSVTDAQTRVHLFRSLLAELPVETLREAVTVLVERAGMRDTAAQTALLAAQIALLQRPEVLRVLHHEGARAEDDEPAEDGDAKPREDEEHKVPQYVPGRTLTLGERKALARRPDRRQIDRITRDPSPAVIELLLNNPRLTEDDVVRMCARRPNVPEVLTLVFANPRWSSRPRVRRSLALNPNTPEPIVAAVVPLLSPEDLRAVAEDERGAPAVRRRCLEVLARLPPIADDPTGQVH